MSSSQTSPSHLLRLSTRTWIRDSHGLFDYETTDYLHTSTFLDSNGLLYRQKTDGKVLECKGGNNNNNIRSNPNNELIITVNKTNDAYTIVNRFHPKTYPTSDITCDLINRFWYVLNSIIPSTDTNSNSNSNANEDYILNQHDIIKLGRIQYVISECHITKQHQPEQRDASYNIGYDNMKQGALFDLVYQADRYEESKGDDKLCKICYSADNEDNNPLVHLCECKGGIRFAHFNCLKQWMKTKECFKENSAHNSASYILKGFNCEICQQPYPFQFAIKGQSKVFALIDIRRPMSEYIVLESLNQMKDNVNTKIIHVIQLNQERYVIGRGHDCDIRINDISVSRTHAVLIYNKSNKKIVIKDHKSKFGSLVMIKAPLVLTQRRIILQVGRTVIETHLVPNRSNGSGSDDGCNVKTRNEVKQYSGNGNGNVSEVNIANLNINQVKEKQGNVNNSNNNNNEVNEGMINIETKNNQSIDSDNENANNGNDDNVSN